MAIDGPGGGGKSSFAARLSRALGDAPILHTDDFASWDEPVHWWPRLESAALGPLAAGRLATFVTSSWAPGHGGEAVAVPPADVILLEGVSSARRAVAARLSYAIWVDAPPATRLTRGLARDGEEARSDWERWAAEEAAFAAADDTRSRADAWVDGAPTIPHDPEREFIRLRP